MFAYLKYGDDLIYNTENIEISAFDEPYLSLTSHTKGIWYFEYSHIEGLASYVIGFASKIGSIAAHPVRQFPKLYAYTVGNISLNGGPKKSNYETDLNLTIEYNQHIGIGIDIDNKNVFYIYNNILTSFKYETTEKEWNAVVRESQTEKHYDKVNVFFERKDFAYDPPFNALPWYSKIKITCNYKNHNNIHSLLLITSTISLSNKK